MRYRIPVLSALTTVTVVLAVLLMAGGVAGASGGSSRSGGSSTSSGSGGSGSRSHIVRSGDSVQSIARRYGVEADDVRAANGIVDDRLYLGSRLLIDGSASSGTPAKQSSGQAKATSSSAPAKGGATYEVKEGDVLERIARRHGVRLSDLLAANDMTATSLIIPGDDLRIPAKGTGDSSGSSSDGSTSEASSGRSDDRSSGAVGPDLRCPVPGASFMNDWGFPRDGGTRFHEGTDLFAPAGTTIVAPISGTLAFATNPLGGSTFTITSPTGWVVYGAHLSKSIGSSRTVAAGEPVARVGTSGNAAGGTAHLHFGLKRAGGRAINPYPSILAACG